MRRSLDIARILNYYGWENQVHKACEEIAELQVAITHDTPRDKVLTELADVLIMAEQLRLMYSIGQDELEREIDFKVDRQIKRIKKERETK